MKCPAAWLLPSVFSLGASWDSPLLFLLSFWLVSQPSLWKLYPTPVPFVGFNTMNVLSGPLGDGFWVFAGLPCGDGACSPPSHLASMSSGGLVAQAEKKQAVLLVSVPLDGDSQSFWLAWKFIIRTLSDESALILGGAPSVSPESLGIRGSSGRG